MASPGSVRRRSSHQDTHQVYASIVWLLTIHGDINETHKGGNATRVLNQLLRSNNVKVNPKDVYNRLASLERRGHIERVLKDGKCYAIRLKCDPERYGANPFSGPAKVAKVAKKKPIYGDFQPGTAVVPVDRAVDRAVLNGHAEAPLRERLALAVALLESIQEDLNNLGSVL